MKTPIVQKTAYAVFLLTLLVMAVTAFWYFEQWMTSETMKQMLLWMTILHFIAGWITRKDDAGKE